MADISRIIDGKLFMWDGEDYESEANAQEKVSQYCDNGFETQPVEDDGKFLVYTRRIAKEVVVEGQPL